MESEWDQAAGCVIDMWLTYELRFGNQEKSQDSGMLALWGSLPSNVIFTFQAPPVAALCALHEFGGTCGYKAGCLAGSLFFCLRLVVLGFFLQTVALSIHFVATWIFGSSNYVGLRWRRRCRWRVRLACLVIMICC